MIVSKVNPQILSAMLTLILVSAVTGLSQEKPLRPLMPDDLFKLEEVGQVALSPDGQWLAYVLRRPKATAVVHARPFLEGNDRGDVWLVSTSGGQPRNLTNGLTNGSGWWAPMWSPDSLRLAMLSTKSGNVHLWLWDKPSGRLNQLTKRGVDIAVLQLPPFAWLNSRQLVCFVLPEGQKPNSMTVEMRAAEIAMREWPKAWRGQETTASALESGIPVSLDRRPQGELLVIDVKSGSRKIDTGFSFRELRLSPDQERFVALKHIGVVRPEPNRALIQGAIHSAVYQAVAFSREGIQVLLGLAEVKEVRPNSLRWSPDGKSLALVGRLKSDGPQAVTCSVTSGGCRAFPVKGEPAALTWSADGNLLMLMSPKPGDRQDWWALNGTERERNITAAMKAVPRELIRETRGSFVGIADGELWRIRLDGGEAQNLTAEFEPRIISTVWPTPSSDEVSVTQVMVNARAGALTGWHRIDLLSGHVTSLPKPNSEATLAGYHAETETAILTARDRAGNYLWLTRESFKQPVTIVETNTQLRQIAQTEFKKIEYRSLDGRELKGWVLLPVGYQAGSRYPLITIAYAGSVFGDSPPGGHSRTINNPGSLNFHLLAARGYAVLFPSMPLKPEGEASDPYLEVTKGVLPAVDKVIELGIADPKRLGVLGQSYGGYATYGLIAQTNRFQAAVSLAGLSDLLSLYGVLDARFRYDQFAHERLSGMSQAETGQIRMGNPPWKDFDRYVRNSPLYQVERIQTPLMIVHGDMDYVAMQQGEQMFSALHRQNKRSTFVRYWGEGHVLEGPANIRDLWRRIYAWFDEFLRGQAVTTK